MSIVDSAEMNYVRDKLLRAIWETIRQKILVNAPLVDIGPFKREDVLTEERK